MRINLHLWDRLARGFFGLLLSAWAFAGGPTWGFIGIYLILTTSFGHDPLYVLFGFRTVDPEDQSPPPNLDV